MAKNNGVSRPIWLQITACGFAAVLISSLCIGSLSFYNQYHQTESADRIARNTDDKLRLILSDIEAARRTASVLALQIADEPGLGDLVTVSEREGIVGRFGHDFSRITQAGGPNVLVVTDAKGKVVARLHDPTSSGDSISDRPMVVSALAESAFTSGNEIGRAGLGIYALAPVVDRGKTVGLVVSGITLANAYFDAFKKMLGVEVAVEVFRGGQFVTQHSTMPGGTMLPAAALADVSAGARCLT